MRSGRRNSKVLIENHTETINSVGEPVETWSTYATAWVEIKTQSGKEFIQAKEQNSELTHILTTHYISGVTPKMRINNGGLYYNILSVFDPTTRKRELKLYCNEQL